MVICIQRTRTSKLGSRLVWLQTSIVTSGTCKNVQSILFIPTLDTTTKFVIMTIWMSRNLRSRGGSWWEIVQEYCIRISSNICFGYLLESPHWGDSNKYPKHMLYEEIRIKQCLSYISFCPLRILYNSKVIIMATSLETNSVLVTRIHCIKWRYPVNVTVTEHSYYFKCSKYLDTI